MNKAFRLVTLLLTFFTLLPTRLAFAAPGITKVQPGTLSNLNPATLTVEGTGFDLGAVVILEGYGALLTAQPISGTVLTAAVPPGIAPGVYTVKVINSDSSFATLANAVTIIGVTATPAATDTPAPTAFARPLLVVQSYGASSAAIASNENLDFEMTFRNAGQATATNIVATFVGGDFVARATGGLIAVGNLNPGESARFFQPLTSNSGLSGNLVKLEVRVSYTDANGTPYTDSFTLTFPTAQSQSSPAATRTPTPTPGPRQRPQLLITNYSADVSPLQPGLRFVLSLEIQNVGSANAKRVTMILGGGSVSGGSGGTPDPGGGGVSGSGGDFSNFAPLDSSNVQSLGDLAAGGTLSGKQTLVVNASTKAGAYPVKFSFVYVDEAGNTYSDDQAITLLVYQPPQVEINFYREVGQLFVGQPNLLPLQVVNLGRTTTVFSNMKVTAEGATFSNNLSLVGTLDPGGYFTLDATMLPDQPGPHELVITINYTDDFNQPQTITGTLTVEVLENTVPDGGFPGGGGGGGGGGVIEPPVLEPETTTEVVVRFIKGFFGLGSARPTPIMPIPFNAPGEQPVIKPSGF